jgi:hypothetical protein
MSQRKKYNSSKVNLTISAIVHSILIALVFFFAAREGYLGKQLKSIAVTMVPKEKKPEPPKPKAEEPKTETAKAETKPADTPKPQAQEPPKSMAVAPPPAGVVPPMAAPPSTALPAFEFNDGAKEVQTTSDKNVLYKGLIEYALRSRWNRPENIADDTFVAEVELRVDETGSLTGYNWIKGSGDKRWDDSVKAVLGSVKGVNKRPPKGFPPSFLVRFDVESAKTEPLMQVSSIR